MKETKQNKTQNKENQNVIEYHNNSIDKFKMIRCFPKIST